MPQTNVATAENGAHALPSVPARNGTLALLEARARLARDNLVAYENLVARGAATLPDVANARAQVFAAESDLARDRADALAPNAGADATASENPATRAAVATLRGELVGIRTELADLHARASKTGYVGSIDVKPGEAVAAGADLANVTSQRPPEIVAYLDPKNAQFATRGHRAWVTFPTANALQRTSTASPNTRTSCPRRSYRRSQRDATRSN